MSPDQPSLTMTLSLIRSDQTYSEPEQLWQFVSNFAVRDYSGLYIVRLVPCTVTEVRLRSFSLVYSIYMFMYVYLRT